MKLQLNAVLAAAVLVTLAIPQARAIDLPACTHEFSSLKEKYTVFLKGSDAYQVSAKKFRALKHRYLKQITFDTDGELRPLAIVAEHLFIRLDRDVESLSRFTEILLSVTNDVVARKHYKYSYGPHLVVGCDNADPIGSIQRLDATIELFERYVTGLENPTAGRIMATLLRNKVIMARALRISSLTYDIKDTQARIRQIEETMSLIDGQDTSIMIDEGSHY